MALRRLAPGFAALWLASGAGAATEELRLDGFESGQTAVFQAGFVADEVGAVRLTPTLSCPCQVLEVTLLFGGAAGSRDVNVLVWDDPAGNPDPGVPPIFDGVATLTGSNQTLQQIDLSAGNVFVSGPFRVGIEFTQDGLPSIARDDDGTIDSPNNTIRTGFGWFRSSDFGVSGDWIVRATVQNFEASVPSVSPPGHALLAALLLVLGARRLRCLGPSMA